MDYCYRIEVFNSKSGQGKYQGFRGLQQNAILHQLPWNPLTKVKGFHVGALKLDKWVISFITTWMLTPRGNNHTMLTEEDLVLVYYIIKNIKVN